MDANLAALLTVVVTSLTTIIIAVLNIRKSGQIEKKVDVGNAMTDNVQTTVNGNTDRLQKQLADAHAKIAELSRQLPPDKP